MPRQKVITLAPTAVDANAITVSETLAAARLSLLINGASQVGYDRNGIAASQQPTGADAMTLDGAGGIDYNTVGGIIVNLYAAGADTARTFTVVGRDAKGFRITEDITGPGTGLITHGSTTFYTITSVTPDAATAGNIEIGSSGIVTFTTPQHVTITSAGDDTGDTFTVTGTDRYGNVMTEAITGVNNGAAAGTKKMTIGRYNGSGSGRTRIDIDVFQCAIWSRPSLIVCSSAYCKTCFVP